MRTALSVGIALLVLFFVSLVQSEVIQLDPTSFNTVTAEGRWFVKFYAPWCGHCKRMVPVWEELGAQENDFSVAEVDCTQHPLLCGRQKISGYPMLKWYENGESKEYRGPRELQPILDWIKSGSPAGAPGNAAKKPKLSEGIKITSENFDEQVLQGVWMVNFYSPECPQSKKFANTWHDLGHAEDYKVGSIDVLAHPELAERYNVRGTPSVVLFKDGEYFRFAGPRSVDFLDRFARSEGLHQEFLDKGRVEKEPAAHAVKDLTENFDKAVTAQNVFVMFYAPWCGHCKRLLPIWNELAEERTDVVIAKVNGTKNRSLMERFSIRGYPTLLLFTADGNEIEHTGGRDLESLSKFLDSRLKQTTRDEL